VPITPDRHPGPLDEDEEIQLGEVSTDPSAGGRMRYVSPGAFRFQDAIGVFNPRSGGSMPLPTQLGQLLYSRDGSVFAQELPMMTDEGFILTTGGFIMVCG